MGNTESAPGASIDDFWHNTVDTATAEEARSTSNFWESGFWGLDTDPDPDRSDASNQESLYEEQQQQQYHYLHQQQGEDQEEEEEEAAAEADGYDDYRANINVVNSNSSSTTAAMKAVESPPQDTAPRSKEDKIESENPAKPSHTEAPAGNAAPAGSPGPDDVTSRSAPMPSPPDAAAAAADMAASAQDDEILAPDVAARGTDLNILKIQISNAAPTDAKLANGGATATVRSVYRVPKQAADNFSMIFFIIHLVSTTAAIIFFIILYVKDITPTKLQNFRRWFPQLSVAVATSVIFGLLCQSLARVNPKLMVRSIVWISVLFTFGSAVMLVSTSLPANLGVGIACLVFSVCQSLYACWISNRVKYAGRLLHYCLLKTAKRIPGIYLSSVWVVLLASAWVLFWSFGVVCSLSVQFAPLIILALLVNLAYTLETLRNVVCAMTAKRVATIYLGQPSSLSMMQALRAAFVTWFGSICMGSLFVPTLHILRLMARGLNRIHTENEFMFSCADCFYNITNKWSMYANNWAYVQVAVHNKSFVKASYDTFRLFESKRLDKVIEKDLTSSICVLSGVSGGMLCVLISGGWTFGIYKPLTSSVSVLSFCIGYFLVRIMMAVPYGVVSAHYVCYGENSTGPEFATSPVIERLKELMSEDAEAAKRG